MREKAIVIITIPGAWRAGLSMVGGVQIERVWEIYSQREQASLMESRAD